MAAADDGDTTDIDTSAHAGATGTQRATRGLQALLSEAAGGDPALLSAFRDYVRRECGDEDAEKLRGELGSSLCEVDWFVEEMAAHVRRELGTTALPNPMSGGKCRRALKTLASFAGFTKEDIRSYLTDLLARRRQF